MNHLVVVGLGYVGMPLVIEATRAEMAVVGLDLSQSLVDQLNRGQSHVEDVSNEELADALSARFSASVDESVMADADVVVICVPTPLVDDLRPDLSMVASAGHSIGRHLSPGTLVVLESTTYPGTTEDVLRPILEAESGLVAGEDFWLAYSPERIDPGNESYGLRNTPKVVGGLTEACLAAAVQFYGRVVDTVVPTVGTREAELSKLLENTYRYVNIALVNEMLLFSKELGVDLWAAIDAARTKPFGFQAFYPGPGVGGHCIPIDPNYLSYAVRTLGYPFRFAELAQEVSERMPIFVANRAQEILNDEKKPVNGSTIVLFGLSYKADISDTRSSPAEPLVRSLRSRGATILGCDPYVSGFAVDGSDVAMVGLDELDEIGCDLAILVQSHSQFEALNWADLGPILDTRNVLQGANVHAL